MSDKNNDQYNEYKYELEKEHNERENRIAGELDMEDRGDDSGIQEHGIELISSNPMVDYSPQDELDRVSNRESYSFFQNNCEI